METYAYEYASETYCISNSKGKLPMTDLFDMIAGTSTGSIMASALSMPDDTGANKFYAQDVIDIYVDNGSTVFTEYTINTTYLVSGTIAFVVFGAFFGFFITLYATTHNEKENLLKAYKEYIKERKKVIIKGKPEETSNTLLESI